MNPLTVGLIQISTKAFAFQIHAALAQESYAQTLGISFLDFLLEVVMIRKVKNDFIDILI